MREYRKQPRVQQLDRERSYRTLYGFSIAEYEEMLLAQDGRCAICRTETPGGPSRRFFFVDHNHVTGRVRGLLCNRCNLAIGMLDDDPERVARLIAYLGGFE